jgi:hypothetical protein
MRKALVVAVLMAAVLAVPVVAQAQAGSTVSQVFFNAPKAGALAQYEAGRTKHMAWHRAQKDAWAWHTWLISSGPSTGAFLVVTSGHHWKDWDSRTKFEEADGVDSTANVGPYMSSSRMSFFTFRPELSLNPEGPPAAMATVTSFMVKPEGIGDFTEAIKKINEAIKKTNYPVPPSRWYSLANGGQGPEFVQVVDRKDWASFEAPEKSLGDMLQEVYGKEDGTKVLDTARRSYSQTMSETLTYRPDLSYVPEGK